MENICSEQQLQKIQQMIVTANNIVITCHLSPDGDALGSSLALYQVLRHIGKKVNVITPDQAPATLSFLPGYKAVTVYTRNKLTADNLVADADLIFCLDYNDLKRLDQFGPVIGSARAPKVLIDHHINPTQFADIIVSLPQMSSTCELLFHLLEQIGLVGRMLGKAGATCLFTGMMTDTGNFTYNCAAPEIYEVVAKLCRLGIDKEYIYNTVMNTNTEDQLRLNGYALSEKMRVWRDKGAALITLDAEELKRFNFRKGDTEGLVNKPLTIPGVRFVAFLREDERYIKVSMRSRGDFAVNVVCEEFFNGGGHKNAAGGEFYGTMDECVAVFERFVDALPAEKK